MRTNYQHEIYCPHCGKLMESYEPSPLTNEFGCDDVCDGDITICDHCGELSAFIIDENEIKSLRKCIAADLIDFNCAQLIEIRNAQHHIKQNGTYITCQQIQN